MIKKTREKEKGKKTLETHALENEKLKSIKQPQIIRKISYIFILLYLVLLQIGS